jgi:hypothetical protein
MNQWHLFIMNGQPTIFVLGEPQRWADLNWYLEGEAFTSALKVPPLTR